MTHDKAFITLVAEICKEAMLSAVTMQIERPYDVTFVVNMLDILPDLLAFNRLHQSWPIPASIEIIAHQISPRVAVNDSIGIHHRNDEELKPLS